MKWKLLFIFFFISILFNSVIVPSFPSYTCKDSDNGINPEQVGYCTYFHRNYTDKCFLNYLLERYCKKYNGLCFLKFISCDRYCKDAYSSEYSGKCIEGKCKCERKKIITCNDTDDGENPFLKGTCFIGSKKYDDRCYIKRWLLERRCDRGRCLSKLFDCDKECKDIYGDGYKGICKNGMCLCEKQKNRCSDTDGIDVFTKGFCTYRNFKIGDRCYRNYLFERYCSSSKSFCRIKIFNCKKECNKLGSPSGDCFNGKCVCAPRKPKIIISEINYDPSGDEVENEYVELYVQDDGGNKNIDIKDWYITTFDGDKGFIPYIHNLDNYDYIVIHTGSGINDLDASDGKAVIYLNRNSPILANNGDEVGLYNNKGSIEDFVRYNGGNGDPVLANWPSSDLGPIARNGESVQIHGKDKDNSSNWISAPPSEGIANIKAWKMDDIPVYIYNGRNYPFTFNNVRRGFAVKTINKSPMIDLNEIKKLEEYLNFSWMVYNRSGFNPPELGPDGVLDISVTKRGSYAGKTLINGSIYIDIGNVSYLNKWTLEHEFMHTIQAKKMVNKSTNKTYIKWNPIKYSFWNEGMAEWWSQNITIEEFNLSGKYYLWNLSLIESVNNPNFNIPPYNISEFASDFDTNVITNYTNRYLYEKSNIFINCLADIYGWRNLVKIHEAIENYGNWNIEDKNDTLAIKAIEKVLKKPFKEILRECSDWNLEKFQRYIKYSLNTTFNGSVIIKNESLNPWGVDYEFIKINTTEPFDIIFKGKNRTEYAVTLLKLLPNGTIEEEVIWINGSAPIRVDDGYVYITMKKLQINGTKSNYTLIIKPLGEKPDYIITGISAIFNLTGNGFRKSANITITLLKPLINESLINNTIYDLEIFFDEQYIPWKSAFIKRLPEGWSGQVFKKGIRLFTNTKPLKINESVKIGLDFTSESDPDFIVIYLTNKTHDFIGQIVASRFFLG